jgi:hypothetical protein
MAKERSTILLALGIGLLAALLATMGLLLFASSLAVATDEDATPDLLPGVDLVTEEVEPGVYRVLADEHRDLRTSVWGVAVSGDGDVWVDRHVDGASRLSRLGREQEYGLSAHDTDAIGTPLSVDRNGAIRANLERPSGEMTFDGEGWAPAEERLALGGSGTADAVAGDGFWASAAWDALEVVRKSDGGVESEHFDLYRTDPRFRLSDAGGGVLVADASDGTAWVSLSTPGASLFKLAKFDGSTFERIDTSDPSGPSRGGLEGGRQNVLIDLVEAPDGTLWVSSWQRWLDVLHVWSWDGLSWTAYDPVETNAGSSWSDVWGGAPLSMGWGPMTGTWFEPDGSIWFDGLVHFDGEQFTALDAPLASADESTVVSTISVAPDGTIWIVMVGGYGQDCATSITCGSSAEGLYVITPEAVAATE